MYTINVHIVCCINILITNKNPYMRPLLLQIPFGKLKVYETGRSCTIRGPGNELEKCVLRETDRTNTPKILSVSPLTTKEH